MFMSLFSRRTGSSTLELAPERPTFMENLEARQLLSVSVPSAGGGAAAAAKVPAIVAAAKPVAAPATIPNITINSVTLNQAGDLVVGGLFGSTPFTTIVDLATTPNPANPACPILNLSLGPIDLNVLGLDVELDDCEGGPVTVDVTANPAGGVLGQLLCGVANLLNSPGGLTSLSAAQAGAFTQLFNNIFGQISNTALTGDNVTATGSGNRQGAKAACDILNLELNEINLNLLGLQVATSDICLRITGERGPGNLLGNLLCGLTGALDGGNTAAVNRILNRIGNLLDRLLG